MSQLSLAKLDLLLMLAMEILEILNPLESLPLANNPNLQKSTYKVSFLERMIFVMPPYFQKSARWFQRKL